MAEKSEWPQWLKDAKTKNARVEIANGVVIWRGGVWRGGVWRGGVWCDGDWHGGDWRGGVWCDGDWHGGVWRGGVWCDGVWRDSSIDRLWFMASLAGVEFHRNGTFTAYRSTRADNRGRHNAEFVQEAGRVEIVDAAPMGRGTCVAGLHVTSMARALTYFGIDPAARLWRVRFTRDDLLDCDGEKCRIRAGECEEIPWPFYTPKKGKGHVNDERTEDARCPAARSRLVALPPETGRRTEMSRIVFNRVADADSREVIDGKEELFGYARIEIAAEDLQSPQLRVRPDSCSLSYLVRCRGTRRDGTIDVDTLHLSDIECDWRNGWLVLERGEEVKP